MNKDKKATAVVTRHPKTLYEKFENWAALNDTKIFIFLISLCAFLSFISFNARISEAHDDALYLEGGWRFVHEFPEYFYTQNAPLYPMLLALFIKIMGFKLIIFKLFSVIFNLIGFVLFYKTLKGRIPAVVFVPVVFFQAANHLIIYYASMTFTEALYFFMQGLFFYAIVRVIDMLKTNGVNLKKQWSRWLMLGLSMFLISTVKSAAIVVIPVVILFFILEKNWRAVGTSLVSYLLFKGLYEIVVRLVWKSQNQFAGQSKILLQKDPYDKAMGEEDVSGFIQRFIDNCNTAMSKRFYQLLGWRNENSVEVYGLVTFLTIALAVIGFYLLYKQKNKVLTVLGLFAGAQIVLSFLILQARWDQPRITLVCMPVLLILMLFALYHFTKKPGMGQTIYLVLAGLMVSSIFISSFKRGLTNLPIVQKNLSGDKYYGYTPDWENFLKCSEWCADSLPTNAFVASRKAPMSFVYGKGKKFFPIYSVVKKDSLTNQSNPDSALAYFRLNKVTHVIIGSLRMDPKNAGSGFINTVHNIVAPIAQKYPDKLRLIHTQGEAEEASVYQIIY